MKSKSERLRILLSRLTAGLAIFLVCISSSAWETKSRLVEALLFCAGLSLAAIGSLGRMWCSLYIAGYKDKELITQGPYSLCRNPLYFFSFIGVVGIGLSTETFTVPAILAVIFLFYYPLVIKGEEKRLVELFGEKFIAYRAKTPGLFPRSLAISEPTTYVVKPKVFRKHIFSALWFIWVIGIAELIEALRDMDVIKHVLRLW